MTARYLGPNNPFLPVATGQIVSYIRDPKEFRLNEYVTQMRSPAPHGSFMRLERDQSVRVTSDAKWAWADGGHRPTGHDNLFKFTFVPFQTERRAYPFTLGNQTIAAAKKHGKWDPEAVGAAQIASQAMTNRTNRIMTLLQTPGNWDSSNVATASSLNGGAGFWDLSSSNENDGNFNAIAKTLMAALVRINLMTNAKIKPRDLVLILSPTQAARMATAGEIHSYMKGSRYSLPWLTRSSDSASGVDIGNINEQWYLPYQIAGVKVVVEDCPIVFSLPKDDGTEATVGASGRAYCKNDTDAILVTRKGALDSQFGIGNTSTVQCYWYSDRGDDGGELEIESRVDDWHRLTECSCVEQYKEVLAAPPTGFLLRDILS